MKSKLKNLAHIDVTPSGTFRVRRAGLPQRTFRELADAVAYRDQSVGVPAPAAPVTRGATLGEFIDAGRITDVHLRVTTKATYEALLRNWILPEWGERELASIQHFEVQAWMDNKVSPMVSPNTAKAIRKRLHAILAAALKQSVVLSNAAEGVKGRQIVGKEMRCLTVEEVRRLAETIDPRYRMLVLTGCTTGLRIGELIGLRWSDVDLIRERLQVRQIVVNVDGELSWGQPKTKLGLRTVPIPHDVVVGLREYRDAAQGNVGANQLVFPAQGRTRHDGSYDFDGGPIDTHNFRERVWRPAVTRVGLRDVRIHEMRHTAVSWWIDSGAKPLEIKQWAGHSSIAFLYDTYGHLMKNENSEATSALNRMLSA